MSHSHTSDRDQHTEVGHDSHEHADHGGNGKYYAVFAALCVLTCTSLLTQLTFWQQNVPKEASWALMMAVSCTKAMLVIMFFMHLIWEANWKWVLTIPATFMSVFLMFMLVPDIGMRINNGYSQYSYERWKYTSNPPAIQAEETEAGKAFVKQKLEH